MTRRRRNPGELSPGEAKEKYLARREADSTEKTIEGWEYRLKLFVEWCEGIGLNEVGQLRGMDLDEYYDVRSSSVKPVTLEGEMFTLRTFVEFLEDLEAVEDGLAEKVRIPDLDAEQRSSEKMLHARNALPLIDYYRNTDSVYGRRQHVVLELAWLTGARQGGLRGLDIRDAHLDDKPHLEFRHRPETGTPLKNKLRGERPVEIPTETAAAVRTYLDEHRDDIHDKHGRQPLVPSTQGRPSGDTVRKWSYLATLPCIRTACIHGKERTACQWTERAHASQCPSSRSPHQIRTGAITHLLNIGWPPEDVAERVNATVKTIEDHYDKAAPEERFRRLRERMETRRRHLIENLDPTDESHDPTH